MGAKRGKLSLRLRKNAISSFFSPAFRGLFLSYSSCADFFLFTPPDKPQPVKIPMPPPLPPGRVLSGKISKGETLSSALRSQSLPSDLIEGICGHLKPVVNLRKVKPGDSFELSFYLRGEVP